MDPKPNESFSPTACTSVQLISVVIKEYLPNQLKPVNQYHCISELQGNKSEHIIPIIGLPVFRFPQRACFSTLHHPPLQDPLRARCLPLDTAGQEWELVPRAWCFYCWWCRGISSCRHLFSSHLLRTFQSLQGRKKNKHNTIIKLISSLAFL